MTITSLSGHTQSIRAAESDNSQHPEMWLDPDSNWGHKDFQSSALPTELSSLIRFSASSARKLERDKVLASYGGKTNGIFADFPHAILLTQRHKDTKEEV